MKTRLADRKCLIIYIIIIVLTSLPIMNGYLYRGHDIYFHLMRIEGLAEGIKSGQFPVKIQPTWYGGFGYAVSVFYGDLFLYIAAVIRLLGVSLQNSYKAYLVFVNIMTVLISGYSFKGIFNNKYVGLFGSFLYSLSMYRLVNLYTRGAVGEYTAMAFLPLIAYSIVLLLNRTRENNELRRGSVLLGVGMACILQSHILTAEIVCMILSGIMIIYIKRILNKDVILAGLKAVAIAVALSLWFMVPFIDYLRQGIFNINNAEDNIMIQSQGVLVSQIFALFDNAVGESFDWRTGREGDFAQGVGLALVIAVPIFVAVIIILRKKITDNRIKEIGAISLLSSVVLIMMSYRRFPWDRLCNMSKMLRYIITNIQFPWRFTGMAVLMLVLLWCTIVCMCMPYLKRKTAIVAICGIILSTLTAGYFMADLWNRGQRIEIYSLDDMDSYVASGEEYLPIDTNLDELTEDNLIASGVEVTEYDKEGTTINLHCKVDDNNQGILELPLLYYEGYKVTGMNLTISQGTNHCIRVEMEHGTDTDITIRFVEPWYWRLSEIASVVAVVMLVISLCKTRKENQ